MTKKNNAISILIAIGFIVIGIISVTLTLVNMGEHYSNIRQYESTIGTIIDVYTKRETIGKSTIKEYTYCDYRYLIDEEVYKATAIAETDYQVGEKITVYYKSDLPEDGYIFYINSSLYVTMGIVGFVLFLIGIAITTFSLNFNDNTQYNTISKQTNKQKINEDLSTNEIWKETLKNQREQELKRSDMWVSKISEIGNNENQE